MPFVGRLFSINPRLKVRGGNLVATTAWRVRVLTLDAWKRTVTVDAVQREIKIERRALWLFRKVRRFRFDWIEGVAYGYRDLTPLAFLQWAHDSLELFTARLQLIGDEDQVHLFHFFGEGTFVNDSPFPDWMMWSDFAYDATGTQDRDSRQFIDALSRAIGAPVVPLRP
ncbi:MAG: hypothetical protein CMJ58_07285 [Planctomycetaceae bacterium]|nr:hypothetical protein [Planctomycetaceae bacterium]